ncbi:MAG: hypothetical protein HYU56_00990 [Candidatus Aenigmarchaeota archaeon]|nr:hypothetical protein [Candidatus Aenigmarchaeota archaeon]
MDEEEYELVPLSPIRRLERKMEVVEKRTISHETIREVLEIIKSNQELVEDIVKVNSEMISRVSDLAENVNMLIVKVNDFVSRIEIAASEESGKQTETPENTSDADKKMDERLMKLEKRVNAVILSSLAKQKIARHA